jgi:hypothetical protein
MARQQIAVSARGGESRIRWAFYGTRRVRLEQSQLPGTR